MTDPTADLQYINNIWITFQNKFYEIIQQELLTKDVTISLPNFTNEEEPLQILVGGKPFITFDFDKQKVGNMSFGFINHMRDFSSTAGIGEWREKAKKYITNNVIYKLGFNNDVRSIYKTKPLSERKKIEASFHLAFTEATNAIYEFQKKNNKVSPKVVVNVTVIASNTGKPIQAKIN
jgi:hypothetical protein